MTRASESKSVLACPASLVLIREREPSANRDKAANWGTLCHWWKETGKVDMPGADPKDVLCLEKKLMLSGIDRNRYWPKGKGEHEVTFGYHLRTLEVRWFRGPRDKAEAWKATLRADPAWMTGTVDWVGSDGTIDDLKTGRWPVDAKENPQLFSYAMPWWLEAGQPLDYDRGLSITQWPRYPLDGLPSRNKGRVRGIDLAEHLSDLQWSLEHPKEANPDKETCRFCECKKTCRAYQASGISYEKSY